MDADLPSSSGATSARAAAEAAARQAGDAVLASGPLHPDVLGFVTGLQAQVPGPAGRAMANKAAVGLMRDCGGRTAAAADLLRADMELDQILGRFHEGQVRSPLLADAERTYWAAMSSGSFARQRAAVITRYRIYADVAAQMRWVNPRQVLTWTRLKAFCGLRAGQVAAADGTGPFLYSVCPIWTHRLPLTAGVAFGAWLPSLPPCGDWVPIQGPGPATAGVWVAIGSSRVLPGADPQVGQAAASRGGESAC